jgi:hypothetical protein
MNSTNTVNVCKRKTTMRRECTFEEEKDKQKAEERNGKKKKRT